MDKRNLTLLILQGIPSSGKSTWAREFIKINSNNWVIINRDSIRDMLGNYWISSREKLVSEIEYLNTEIALSWGYNVIIDATNLNVKTLNKFQDIANIVSRSSEYNIIIESKEFKILPHKAIFRNWKRGLFGGRSVGKKVIMDFYNKYYGKKQNNNR